ncbi:hypothetical protein IB237_12605 [Agrobacterium sp. AGB01]|uniref:hypothetical protein n=1 Tax=Agrobacterium sp. AGB01 TaxID=2769302 RepID=UPI00177BFB23|nr:hypothetical protein [Agrobacterium sp. AGB01]MBD9388020.1 hypothetical protein [Agrobacterium sp. AGB01]
MVAGMNMLSFDLFGLGRKMPENKSETGSEKTAAPTARDEASRKDVEQEHELFFWSLYPVI